MSDSSGMYKLPNPMLLDPNATTDQRVPAHISQTKPFPVVLLEEEGYYFCTLPAHHMFRTDGKRLAFVYHICATKDAYDVKYLEDEITLGNPYLRKASDREIHTHNMRINPTKTMTDSLRPKIESDVRTELQVQLRNEMERKLNSYEGSISEEDKKALMEKLFGAPETEVPPGTPTNEKFSDQDTRASNTAGSQLAGTEAIRRLSGDLGASIPSGTGRLMGIVGTDKIPSSDSNQV